MTISIALHAAMNVIDNHADKMGSGPYCELAGELKLVADSVCAHEAATKRAFAMDLIAEVPASAAASCMAKFLLDRKFMRALMHRKAVQLSAYEPYGAAIVGHAWKVRLADALILHDGAVTLGDVRRGIFVLLGARSGFLNQIVHRLNKQGVTPQMLCPVDLCEAPVPGDVFADVCAMDFLALEPRMLRWMLGKGELEPWPQVGGAEDPPAPAHVCALVEFANRWGGDDANKNQPCTCHGCLGVRIPTMDALGLSLGSSECGSESGEDTVS